MTATIDVASVEIPATAMPLPVGHKGRGYWTEEEGKCFEANRPQSTQCPPWCVQTASHDWQPFSVNPYVYSRAHYALDTKYAYVIREEVATVDRHLGWNPWQAVVVSDDFGPGEFTDPAELRVVVAELAAAARKLEEVLAHS